LENIIAAIIAGIAEWNHSPDPTWPNALQFLSGPVNNLVSVIMYAWWAVPELDQSLGSGSNPDHSWVTQN